MESRGDRRVKKMRVRRMIASVALIGAAGATISLAPAASARDQMTWTCTKGTSVLSNQSPKQTNTDKENGYSCQQQQGGH
jgi:hypothetical protein